MPHARFDAGRSGDPKLALAVLFVQRGEPVERDYGHAGASRAEQVHENMKASEVTPKLTPEIIQRIDTIFIGEKEEEED